VKLLAVLLLAATGPAPVYPGDEELIGFAQTHLVAADESLIEIARDYDLGFNAIAEANPTLDPFVPGTGATVALPTAWILPRAAAPGTVVVNLSEMRLYYFSRSRQEGGNWVVTFPIGIGSEGTETPLGRFQVVARERNPVWRVPVSIRKEKPELPAEVPPGPDNPLGTHALHLSGPFILIHGTDKPYGVGRRASHGCLRLYPEDIPQLYRLVHVGTEVTIVREPVKVALHNGHVYMEVHADEDFHQNTASVARRLLADRALLDRVDGAKLEAAVQHATGTPVDITR
jgi:L,D-transpeptidase ErfK/SrfK